MSDYKIEPLFRDIKYVSEALGMSPQTIKRWVRQGKFPQPVNYSEFSREKLGGTEPYRWTRVALNAWYKDYTGSEVEVFVF